MQLLLLVTIRLFTLALFVSSTTEGTETGFLTRTVTINDTNYNYQVFVPAQWSADDKWPVIFFLHGAGERGSDGFKQTTIGLPKILRNKPDFPAVVVMPQCKRALWWGDPLMEAQAFAALESSIEEFNGDSQRIYLTGLSMGGYATWAFGYKYNKKFAALVPISGGVMPRRNYPAPKWHPASITPLNPHTETAKRIRKTPTWVFHGEVDKRVPVSESRKLIKALRSLGGNVRYTEYPGVKHNAWDKAYEEILLLPWILSQRKSDK